MSEFPKRRAFLATAGITVASVIDPRLMAQPDKTKTAPMLIVPGIRVWLRVSRSASKPASHRLLNSWLGRAGLGNRAAAIT